IAAGPLHLAEDEERPIVEHLDIDARIDEVVLAVALRDLRLGLADGLAGELGRTDQRQGHHALVIDVEIAREILLAEDGYANLVPGAKAVSRGVVGGAGSRGNRRDKRQKAAQQHAEEKLRPNTSP